MSMKLNKEGAEAWGQSPSGKERDARGSAKRARDPGVCGSVGLAQTASIGRVWFGKTTGGLCAERGLSRPFVKRHRMRARAVAAVWRGTDAALQHHPVLQSGDTGAEGAAEFIPSTCDRVSVALGKVPGSPAKGAKTAEKRGHPWPRRRRGAKADGPLSRGEAMYSRQATARARDDVSGRAQKATRFLALYARMLAGALLSGQPARCGPETGKGGATADHVQSADRHRTPCRRPW